MISVIIPVYNEQESISELFEKLTTVLKRLKYSYEILFVDDGSTDETLQLLKKLEEKYKEVKVYSFRKNIGKSYALRVGFKHAQGEYIMTLDADLQDDPDNIQQLLRKLHDNDADMVAGWRKNRKDHVLKRIPSQIFNSLIGNVFNLQLHDLNCGLKLYKNQVTKELNLYGGMHRFIPLLVSEMGYKVVEQEVVHHPRKYGVSKYKMTKIITDIPDLFTIYFLTKYTHRPLHFFGKVGSFVFILGLIILFYLSTLHFLGQAIGRRPLLLFGMLFVITGIQIIFTGLIADMLVNTSSKDQNHIPLKYESSK